MSRAYTDIAFTPAVRAMQTHMGSRANYAPLDHTRDRRDVLGEQEAAFIAARDGFYQATVSQTGWPYVQFRGGPAGFLKVLDERTIGYADFRGNVQYISVGNLADNDRVSIILMDYANRRRLKILGRVRLVGLDEDPALIARLELPDYRARVERGVIISIEGYDWNCPQHITPRFTEAEIAAANAPLREELARLKAQLATAAALKTAETAMAPQEPPPAWGSGPLSLVISGVRQLTPRVRAYELRAADGGTLPAVAAGAHIDMPVRLSNASGTDRAIESTRRYSILAASTANDRYEIAVQHHAAGRGGSAAVHRDYHLGMVLHCGLPGNDFALHTDSRPTVLIAGGIGITPLHSMALALAGQGRSVHLHYAARSRPEAALAAPLQALLGADLHLYLGDAGDRMDAAAVVRAAAPDSVFYVCGPQSLLDAVRGAAAAAGIGKDHVRFERFSAATARPGEQAIRVTLQRSGKVIDVGAEQTILDAVETAGVSTPSACRTGTCGTCAVKVLAGKPDHRDHALSRAEQLQAGLMCICVSRAQGGTLTLDL